MKLEDWMSWKKNYLITKFEQKQLDISSELWALIYPNIQNIGKYKQLLYPNRDPKAWSYKIYVLLNHCFFKAGGKNLNFTE